VAGRAEHGAAQRVGISSAARAARTRMVLSMEPVMTCGSTPLAMMLAMVLSWPASEWICALVRMSHTRHTESRPPVMRTSSVGCSAMA